MGKIMARLLHVGTPFFDQGSHIIRKPGIEPNRLPSFWMYEPKCLCVKGLSRTQLEAVLYELPVFGVDGSLSYFRAAVTGIIE